jgi:hypothetical protein
MTQYIQMLLADDNLRQQIGLQAAAIAQDKFSLELMSNNYLNWHQLIIALEKGRYN